MLYVCSRWSSNVPSRWATLIAPRPTSNALIAWKSLIYTSPEMPSRGVFLQAAAAGRDACPRRIIRGPRTVRLQTLRETPDRRMTEKFHDGELDAEALLQHAMHLHEQERIPADIEEVVVGGESPQSKRGTPRVSDETFDAGRGWGARVCPRRVDDGRRQTAAINLAARRERQSIDH